jgi:hypothetical protein
MGETVASAAANTAARTPDRTFSVKVVGVFGAVVTDVGDCGRIGLIRKKGGRVIRRGEPYVHEKRKKRKNGRKFQENPPFTF